MVLPFRFILLIDQLKVTFSYLPHSRQLNDLYCLTTGTGLEKTWFQMSDVSYKNQVPFSTMKGLWVEELGATFTESNKWYSREEARFNDGMSSSGITLSLFSFHAGYVLYFWLFFKRGKLKPHWSVTYLQSILPQSFSDLIALHNLGLDSERNFVTVQLIHDQTIPR